MFVQVFAFMQLTAAIVDQNTTQFRDTCSFTDMIKDLAMRTPMLRLWRLWPFLDALHLTDRYPQDVKATYSMLRMQIGMQIGLQTVTTNVIASWLGVDTL